MEWYNPEDIALCRCASGSIIWPQKWDSLEANSFCMLHYTYAFMYLFIHLFILGAQKDCETPRSVSKVCNKEVKCPQKAYSVDWGWGSVVLPQYRGHLREQIDDHLLWYCQMWYPHSIDEHHCLHFISIGHYLFPISQIINVRFSNLHCV